MDKKFLCLGIASAIGLGSSGFVFTAGAAELNYSLDNASLTAAVVASDGIVDEYTGDIEIPATLTVGNTVYTVTAIDDRAFKETDITSVTLPASITSIGQGAFQSCLMLERVVLNEGLQTLDYDVFNSTKALKSITIPGSLATIPYNAFGNSGLESVVINYGVQNLENAFINCSDLREVSLPESIVTITGTFENCTSLSHISLPGSLRTIKSMSFAGTAITELELPEGLETLEARSLGMMNGTYNADYTLRKITFPSSLKNIAATALNNRLGLTELVFKGNGEALTVTGSATTFIPAGCSLKSMVLNRCFYIPDQDYTSWLVNQLTDLTDLTLGSGMTSGLDIPACTALRNVTVECPEPPSGATFSQSAYSNATLHVPAGCANAFSAATGWKNFVTIEEPALPKAIAVDVDKVRYTVGEGACAAAVVICFGADNRLDNLVYGYRYENTMPDAGVVLAEIAAADKRLSVASDGEKVTSVAFDLNGDNVIDALDVMRANDACEWSSEIYSAEGMPVMAVSFGTPAGEAPYYFYLPAPDEEGIWLPEEMTVPLSDKGCVLPVLIQPQGKTVGVTTNWQASQSNTSYLLDRTLIVTPYTLVDGTYNARPTFTGATGTTYVRYRPTIGGSYVESNYMTLNITAPEVPVESLIFDSEVTSGLNRVVELSYSYTPENATYTALTFSSSDTKVATWSATAGLKTTTVAGSATITATSMYNPEVKASFTLVSQLLKPVTDVNFGPGTEDGVINVPVRQLVGLKPVIFPEDADVPTVTVTLSDNGTSKADYTCTTYNVNWWDINNVRSTFYELSGHRPTGDHPAKITVKSADGALTKEFTVNVIEADRTPLENGYVDGTIILNEEWFGHTNGGLNYITENDEIIYQAYERENPGMSFGATSQYGMIWAGKLIVASKQATDGGDPLPGGGRLVIADAKTLKRIGSLDTFSFDGKSGDGRAVTGATPDKIYAGTSNGIFVVDISDPEAPVVTGRIGLSDSADLYNGQIGDMITAKNHAFAVMQSKGLIIIDTETDEFSLIADTSVQGVTQSADGNVWYCTLGADDNGASRSVFVCLDPETCEEIDRVNMPASIGTVVCGWGAWRSTAFKGSLEDNDLWFVTGAASIMGGASGDYYRYHIGDEPETIKTFFSLADVTGINGFGEEVGQMTYGTPMFDSRNNRLVVMAGRKGAASGGYRDHWIHFVDGDNGEISGTIKLNPYYWFQSLPIFPDKYEAEINIDNIAMAVNDTPLEIDLTELVTDRDNIDSNIRLSLDTMAENAGVADMTLNGNVLTVAPRAKGQTSLTVNAESNGRLSSKTVTVSVGDINTGIDSVNAGSAISFRSGRLYIDGYRGTAFSICNTAGIELVRFVADSDSFVLDFGAHSGVFIVRGDNGVAAKIAVRK